MGGAPQGLGAPGPCCPGTPRSAAPWGASVWPGQSEKLLSSGLTPKTQRGRRNMDAHEPDRSPRALEDKQAMTLGVYCL